MKSTNTPVPFAELSPEPRGDLRRGFLLAAAGFTFSVVLLLTLGWVDQHATAGASAYIRGESTWSKAQRDAVAWLYRYSETEKPAAMEQFRASLSVIDADREARLALEQSPPAEGIARRALIRGGNLPRDVDKMILLFRFRDYQSDMRNAVEAWQQSDSLVEELRDLSSRLASAVQRSDEVARDHALTNLALLNDEFNEVERRFSDEITDAAHWLRSAFFLAQLALGALILSFAGFLGYRLMLMIEDERDRLSSSERRYRAMATHSFAGIWQVDRGMEGLFTNPALARMLEVDDPEDMIGESWLRWFGPEGLQAVQREEPNWARGQSSIFEAQLIGEKGTRLTTIISAAPVLDDEGRLESIISTVVDISQRKAMSELLEHQSLHDPLTELPNRILFLDRLKHALARGRRKQTTVAVLYLDLDRFKAANDYYGHEIGDSLLLSFGQRLVESMREEDTVARLGGDEFAILLENLNGPDPAIEAAERIGGIVQFPLDLDGSVVRLSSSIGIALSDGPWQVPEDLLRHADIAMFAAKQKGLGSYHLYDADADQRSTRRFKIERDLWEAIEAEQFELHYQPIVDLKEGQIVGCEALIRWNHPDRGLISPAEFIPLAEENGAILPLGRWVIRKAFEQQLLWRFLFGRERKLFMSVNLSSMQFRLSELPEEIRAMLRDTGVDAESMHFEITESLLMQAPAAVRRLKSLGVHISIDDFGTGYSSLGTLRRIAVDILKVDKGFVDGLGTNNEDTALVKATLDMAAALNLSVVAEGVETEEQLSILRQMDCAMAQGYLFSQPIPAPEFEKLLDVVPVW